MPIPDFQSIMLPVLKLASSANEYKLSDAIEKLADDFGLSSEERNELLPSGTQAVFNNRVAWARSYLKQAGLVNNPRTGFFSITENGRLLLAEKPERINTKLLEKYPEFQEFRNRKKSDKGNDLATALPTSETESKLTPEDALASAYNQLRSSLESEILATIMSSTPSFFERLVVDLLVKMGYGGSRQEAGRALGRSGDGGIDGIINEDRLGLDVIYIQAKRWEGVVGRPEIQKFAGALQGQRANKGVFITTSSFTSQAKDYTNVIASKIILIDGEQLSALMAEHNVGVSVVGQYEVKKLDSDYFYNE